MPRRETEDPPFHPCLTCCNIVIDFVLVLAREILTQSMTSNIHETGLHLHTAQASVTLDALWDNLALVPLRRHGSCNGDVGGAMPASHLASGFKQRVAVWATGYNGRKMRTISAHGREH